MFEYYEIVKVIACAGDPELIGAEGYVAGKSYEDGGPIEGYGIFLFDAEEVYSFDATEIVSLGRFVDPNEVMSGDSIRVRNEDGRGVIVDKDD